MKHYEDFRRTGVSFRERIGPPTEFDAAIGRIALGFSQLEDTARNVILLLSAVPPVSGRILISQLSFRQKVDTLSALFLEHTKEQADHDIAEMSREVLFVCRRSEESQKRLRSFELHHGS